MTFSTLPFICLLLNYFPSIEQGESDEYVIHVNSFVPGNDGQRLIIDTDSIHVLSFTSKSETVYFSQETMLESLEKKIRSIPRFIDGKDGKRPPSIKLQINNKLKFPGVFLLMDVCRKAGKESNINDIKVVAYPEAEKKNEPKQKSATPPRLVDLNSSEPKPEPALVLNIDGDGHLLIPARYQEVDETLDSADKITKALKRIWTLQADPKKITVVIRPSQSNTFEQVYRIMKASREVGFVNVVLRGRVPN